MSIKIGDKVRFLNSVGGGIVRSFRGKEQVIVEDEDGFDMPTLIRECIVVGDKNEQMRSSNRSPLQTSPQQAPAPQAQSKPVVEEVIEETPGGERLNISLAYLPTDPKAMQQCGYEAYFVNDSNYYLFINYMNRDNNSWMSRYSGLVEPNTKIFLEEFAKADLNSLERICVQMVAFKKNKPYALKNTISVELHLDIVKFYKQHCFMDNDFFEEDALVYPVVREDVPEKELLISAADLKEAMLQKAQDDRRAPQAIVKKKADNAVLEVDLHINALLDSTTGMTPADMLTYQLDKFHEIIAQYAAHKGQKIVFIHGKGDGVLRRSIETELKTKYKQYSYQDASFREYGFGATMITIK
ncbi:MAG: DUF2027 domain-containing protein [Tannerellaceae bacterium]